MAWKSTKKSNSGAIGISMLLVDQIEIASTISVLSVRCFYYVGRYVDTHLKKLLVIVA